MNSKCASCGGFIWEIAEEVPNESAFKVNFIRCSLCKVPIGVIDYYHTHTKLEQIEKTIKQFGDSLVGMLEVIDGNIRRLFQK